MPLRIKLKPKERLIVNGTVIENSGAEATLTFHNHAKLLRAKDILTEKDANTPARRVYFALQSVYLFPEDSPKTLEILQVLLQEYTEAAPSALPITRDIWENVEQQNYYQGLRRAQDLIAHEEERFAHVEKSGTSVRSSSAGGQSGGN